MANKEIISPNLDDDSQREPIDLFSTDDLESDDSIVHEKTVSIPNIGERTASIARLVSDNEIPFIRAQAQIMGISIEEEAKPGQLYPVAYATETVITPVREEISVIPVYGIVPDGHHHLIFKATGDKSSATIQQFALAQFERTPVNNSRKTRRNSVHSNI